MSRSLSEEWYAVLRNTYFYLNVTYRTCSPLVLSLSRSPGERWGEASGCFFFFISFFLKLENLHSRRMSTSTPEATGPALWAPGRNRTVICSVRKQLHIAELLVCFCWMLYRRNCNTLLSSSLQRCYINGVCFAFQLAALWKRRSVIFVLGNINSHPSVKINKRNCRLIWASTIWITQFTHRTMRKD